MYTHTHKHTLKCRNTNAHKLMYSFKEGRRKVAIQRLSFCFLLPLPDRGQPERILLVPLMAMRRGDWIWSCLAPEPSVSAEITKQFWK